MLKNGNVGIGIASPAVALDVDGDVQYTGIIADVSDSRLKTKVEDLPAHQGDAIGALKPVSFEMKDREGVRELGFIAQDVEEVFPELVHESDAGVKSLNYVGLIAPMVKAIQQMQEENATLRARVDGMERRDNPAVQASGDGQSRVIVDEQTGIIRLEVNGEEVARFDAEGLQVKQHIRYGGYIVDEGNGNAGE